MTQVPQAAIDAANASEDDLLLELGTHLAPDANRDSDPADLRGRAHEWLDRERAALRKLLCGYPALRTMHDTAVDIAVLADFIAAATGSAPVYSVAAIILKRGHTWLCGKH